MNEEQVERTEDRVAEFATKAEAIMNEMELSDVEAIIAATHVLAAVMASSQQSWTRDRIKATHGLLDDMFQEYLAQSAMQET